MQQPAGSRLEIGEAFSAGWRNFWPNILPMALFALIVWGVNFLVQVLQPEGFVSGLLVSVVGFLVGQLISIGWITIGLRITDGQPVTSEAVTERFSVLVPYLVAALLYTIMVSVGLLLLIIPGIILAIVFVFYGFHIVDTGERDPIAALRRSAELTRGRRGQLFAFFLALIALNILGVLLFLVGVLITSGISLLAMAHAYRQLSPVSPVDPAYDPYGPGPV